MLNMAYAASRDSQEGVVCRLVDELRDTNTKEAALAVTAFVLNCWGAQNPPSGLNPPDSPAGAISDSTVSCPAPQTSRLQTVYTEHDIDRACEAFLERRFGVHVSVGDYGPFPWLV